MRNYLDWFRQQAYDWFNVSRYENAEDVNLARLFAITWIISLALVIMLALISIVWNPGQITGEVSPLDMISRIVLFTIGHGLSHRLNDQKRLEQAALVLVGMWTINVFLESITAVRPMDFAYLTFLAVIMALLLLRNKRHIWAAVSINITVQTLPILSFTNSAYAVPQAIVFLLTSALIVSMIWVVRTQLEDETTTARLRTRLLQTNNQLSTEVLGTLDLIQLAERAVSLIEENFADVIHARIYFLDASGRRLELRAAGGELGQELLARRYSIPLRSSNVVSRAVRLNEITLNRVEIWGRASTEDVVQGARVELAFPLQSGDQAVGVLSVFHDVDDPSDIEIEVLTTTARFLSLAVENAQTFASEVAMLESASPIFGASRRIVLAETPSEFVQVVHDVIGRDVGRTSMYLIERAADGTVTELREVVRQQGGDIHMEPARIPAEDDAATFWLESILDGQPLVIQNVDDLTGDQELPRSLRTKGLRSFAAFPLMAQGETIGFMLTGAGQPTEFTGDQIGGMQTLSDQIAIAYRNRELVNVLQDQAQRLEEQVRTLNTLYELAQTLASSLETDFILQQTTEQLAIIFNVDGCGVSLFDAEQGIGRLAAAYPNNERVGTFIPLNQMPFYEQMQKRREIISLNSEQTPGYFEEHPELINRFGIHTVMMVPLIVRDELMGALRLSARRVRYLEVGESTMLQALAAQIAIALQNAAEFEAARRRASVETFVNEMTVELQQRSDIESMLDYALREVGDQIGARRARVRLNIEEDGSNGKHEGVL
jgi:GAF domain-containing protein